MKAEENDALYAKLARRLIPFMMLLYLVAFLDRVNVGFAALTMNRDLGITPYVYGWGAGIFFLGYFFFEVPSNVILEKVGARLWIGRIMITWGLISTAMAGVEGAWSFLTLRFLLGVAEAGFLPGMLLYLTYWFPARMRGKYISLFMAAVPLANIIGAPISGYILEAGGWFGLKGWQTLFVLEGLPSCLLGVIVLLALPDGPQTAKWLSDEERRRIASAIADDHRSQPSHGVSSLWPALRDPRVFLLGMIYFGIVIGLYGIGLWLPQIIKLMGFSNLETGLIAALPYVASAGAMFAWGRSSDRTGERILHIVAATIVSAVGFVGSVYFANPTLALLSLTVACLGIYSTFGPFWSVPSAFLRGTAAAGGIALVNSIGNLGGFVGPYVVGWTREATGGFAVGLGAMAVCLVASALLSVILGWTLRRQNSREASDVATA